MNNGVSSDHLPVGTIPLFATASAPAYAEAISKFTLEANRIFADFLRSEEGRGFCGQVCLVGDSVGAIVAYDALCVAAAHSTSTTAASSGEHVSRLRSGSDCSLNDVNGGDGGGGNAEC